MVANWTICTFYALSRWICELKLVSLRNWRDALGFLEKRLTNFCSFVTPKWIIMISLSVLIVVVLGRTRSRQNYNPIRGFVLFIEYFLL